MPALLHRPAPVAARPGATVTADDVPQAVARRLRSGETLLLTDHYRTGVAVLEALRRQLDPPGPDAPFDRRQAFDDAFRETALRLLAPVRDHRVALIDVPGIGFLGELYPDLTSFFLPFVQVQELHGAWERYVEGTHLAVLGHRLHPFYGTYVPTRTSHLELFATWLSQYAGSRDRAVDVGTGSGVLALMLAKAGFEHIRATDQNPNAIESLRRELARRTPAPDIELEVCDLLGDDPLPVDLVVFNPPWVKGPARSLLDQALTFPDGLFERFFDQAAGRLAADGRVVLLFSTILSLVQPDVPHPIEAELERGRFRLVSKARRKVKPSPGPDGARRRTRERVEVWELALEG